MYKKTVLLILGFCLTSHAQDMPPLEAYGMLPAFDMYELSPSGKLGASRVTHGGKDSVMVFDIDKTEFITGANAAEVNPRWLQFISDEHLILVAGRTVRNFSVRNTFDFSQAHALNLETDEIKRLLRGAQHLYPYQSGLGRIIGVNPSADSIYMPAFVEPRRGDKPVGGIYSVGLGKNRPKLMVRGNRHTIDWFMGKDGSPVVREDFDDEENIHQIWTVDEKGKNKELVYECHCEIPAVATVGITEARDALVLLTTSEVTGAVSYYQLSLEDGTISGPILASEGRDIERVVTDINRVVHGVEYAGFKPAYVFFDEKLDERVRAIQGRIAGPASRLVSWSDDFRRLIFEISGGWTAGAYLMFDEGVSAPTFLAESRSDFEKQHVVPVEITSYTAQDGLEIPALVTAREDVRAKGGAPLIVMPHGGPESHDVYGFDWLAQYFASRGYVILQPQFRGSDGFGYELLVAGEGEWGGKMQSDLDDGVRHLIAGGLADKDRVCMVGASYGGYAALAAGAFSPDMYRCIVAIAPVSDLRKKLQRARSERGRGDWVIDYWESLYGADASEKDILRSISPANHADAFQAPVLLIHGEKDTVVDISQSTTMHKALKRAKKDVTFIKLKGEDHWLTQEKTRVEALKAAAEFIDQHL